MSIATKRQLEQASTGAHAVGYLECLSEVAYERLLAMQKDVELAAHWPGESGKLFEALMNCGGDGRAGFIEQREDRHGRWQSYVRD